MADVPSTAFWNTIAVGCVSLAFTGKSVVSLISWLWAAVGEFLQTHWEKLLDYVGEDPLTLWVYGPMAVMVVVYWGLGIIFILIDVTYKPATLRKYKMRPGTNEPIEYRKLFKAIFWVLFNHTVAAYPFGMVCYWVMEYRGYPAFRQLPSLPNVLGDFLVFLVISEAVFYYSHRLLHVGVFYKYIHKKHHEWHSPISITAFYCHPIEHIIGNLATLNIGFMVTGSHVFTVYLYYAAGIVDALNNHCGYHFPFMISPEFHDFHHSKFNENFGLLGVLDRLHGTDRKFKESVEYKRHSVMLHLVPQREYIRE